MTYSNAFKSKFTSNAGRKPLQTKGQLIGRKFSTQEAGFINNAVHIFSR